jgi:hypothetical protein
MNISYAVYAVLSIPVLYLAGKGAVATLDQGFRWLADRNGF